ncbi:AAA family ATPase [Actinomycetota bacterium]
MGIILYIGKNKEITDSITEITLKNYEVAILNCNYYYKHHIEEYMPDYIILSADIDNYSEISKYIAGKQSIKLIVTDKNRLDIDQSGNVLQISGTTSAGQINEILNIIDKIDQAKPDNNGKYKYVKQEVLSFYSIQGGVGKTSIAFNTAWYLSKKDIGKILFIDLNFCEGPSDMSIRLKSDRLSNMSSYIKNTLKGIGNIQDSVTTLNNIDIMMPPLSLHQSDGFNLDMLNNLIYSARNDYDVIITDIPFRYDNVSLEMLNLSTSSVIVLSPDINLAPRVVDFQKFLPEKQKKAAILNKVEGVDVQIKKDYENIIGIPFCGQFDFVPKDKKKLLKDGKSVIGLPDMQADIWELINYLF